MNESKFFELPNPKVPTKLHVSYVVDRWKNSEGRYRQTVDTITFGFMHYDKAHGIIVELLGLIGLIGSKELLEGENRFPTSVRILSWQFPVPGKEPVTMKVWNEEAVVQVIDTKDPRFQVWLRYQHFPPNPDEPNEPTKTGNDE